MPNEESHSLNLSRFSIPSTLVMWLSTFFERQQTQKAFHRSVYSEKRYARSFRDGSLRNISTE
jgi:S-adenosylmethionine:tRNA-ribosyltransferase-isomerase (queuine synthetase)